MLKTHTASALAAGLLSLILPLAAFASDPPSVLENQSACGGRYSARLQLEFGQTGTTASAHAEASLVRHPFVHGSIPYPSYFVAESTVMRRNSVNPNWTSDTHSSEVYGAFSTSPVTANGMLFKDAGCELVASAIVNVHCPDGSWETKQLTRNWVGCGL